MISLDDIQIPEIRLTLRLRECWLLLWDLMSKNPCIVFIIYGIHGLFSLHFQVCNDLILSHLPLETIRVYQWRCWCTIRTQLIIRVVCFVNIRMLFVFIFFILIMQFILNTMAYHGRAMIAFLDESFSPSYFFIRISLIKLRLATAALLIVQHLQQPRYVIHWDECFSGYEALVTGWDTGSMRHNQVLHLLLNLTDDVLGHLSYSFILFKYV